LDAPRSPGWFGGVLAAEVVATSWEAAGGTWGIGGRVELAVRDRVVGSVLVTAAPGARLDALRAGRARYGALEARLGLRQRIGRGPWTVHVDATGGLVAVTTLEGAPDLRIDRSLDL